MDTTPAALFAGLVGLLTGSFLNVVAFRLPRHESLVHPRSHCPGCDAPVRPYDNVPVLSWLVLRGRCRDCGTRISARYPVVEAATALLAVAVVLVKGPGADVWLALALLGLLVPVALIDAERQVIPNVIVATGSVAALVIGALADPGHLPEQLIAGAAAGAFLLGPAVLYPAGMGMGDVKLAAMMGLFLGRSVAVALLVGLLAGALVGVGVMARVGVARGRKAKVPFGPFLAFGGVVAMLAGPAVVHWYLHTMV